MTDWSLPPDLQQRYEEILAEIRRLQDELGVEPQTLEQRHQAHLQKQAEETRKQEELKKLGQRRSPPKWKV